MEGRKIVQEFKKYGIFQPNTSTLRGIVPDVNQLEPVGLNGGRLAEALQDLFKEKDEEFFMGSLYMDDVLEMIDWASDVTVSVPKKNNINPNVPTTRQIIEFLDRFMKDSVKFTGYDASEGALYGFVYVMSCHASAEPCDFFSGQFRSCVESQAGKKNDADIL